MKIKQFFKKAAAMVMAAVTVLSLLPATAFAATGDVGTISFTHTYDSAGNVMHYNSSAVINGYTAGGTGKNKYRMYVDGSTAFCIQPGVPLKTGNKLTENSSETWNALSASQKKAVGLALLYGYQGNRDSLTGSDDEKWLATQTLVWEFVTGCRNSTGSFAQTDTTVYNLHFGSNYPNSGAAAAYAQIVSTLTKHNTVPSFMNGSSRELEYKDGQYILTLTDTNGVLSEYSFSSSDRSVNISKSGNTLTISSANAFSGTVQVTATRNNIPVVSESAKLIAYGDPDLQDRLIALHDLDCPWRPSDLAQRLGRIVRQGNQNPEVEIFRYVTESTFDAYLYQLVENKQKFIAQIMTSKAPVRVADDVDETALSYSEIKALATGNPLIIEKCNLDMEVGKLNMLRASYLSQKYGLEDMVLKKYPEAITRLTERIAGYGQDVQLAAAHPKPKDGFAGITILEKPYADKEAAGKAILDVCTKMTGSDAVFLGQYRGFSLVLSYDGPSNEYRMTMKGTLSHTAVLGADVFGNLTRMDNVVDGLPGKLDIVRAELTDTQVQLENAKTELATPFAKEAELAEKTARLKELNILLNMDEKDKSLIDDVPDDDAPEHHRSRGMER